MGVPRVSPEEGMIESLFSRFYIVLGILLGILLVWIGAIVFTFGIESEIVTKVAATLNFLGFASLGTFLIGGGIANRDIDKFVRLGMILGGALMLGLTLSVALSGAAYLD